VTTLVAVRAWHHPGMDRSVLWRAALLQAVLVAIAALVLGAALDREFFEDWGWLAGPGTWAACALVTGAVLRLPAGWTLLGAALAGVPSLLSVIAGVHWAGVPLAVGLFAVWCARLAVRRGPAAGTT
jgi:hypothetical protein